MTDFKSDFSGNFLAAQDHFQGLVGYRREGSVLVASYRFKAPRILYGKRVRSFSMFTFQFTTANFGEAYLDLRDDPAVYTID